MVEQSSRQGDGEALVDYSLVWREPADARAASAVALVIHGLNVNPLRMDPLAHELNSWGVATLRCTLSGHANSLPAGEARLASLRQVTYGLWRDEAAAAYRVAAQQAEQSQRPHAAGCVFARRLDRLYGCAAQRGRTLRPTCAVCPGAAYSPPQRYSPTVVPLAAAGDSEPLPGRLPRQSRYPHSGVQRPLRRPARFRTVSWPPAQHPHPGLCRSTRRDGVVPRARDS